MLAAAPRPVFLGRPSTVFCVAVNRVDGGHQAGLDAETFLEDDMHERREAVLWCRRALEMMLCLAASYSPSLTPMTMVFDLAFAGRGDDDFSWHRR